MTTNSSLAANSTPRKNAPVARHNRIVTLVFLLLFGLPALVALWLHHGGAWQSSIRTAHGELMKPLAHLRVSPKATADLPSDVSDHLTSKRWKMLFKIPPVCHETCLATLYQMNQVHQATGPDYGRVQRWLVFSPRSDPSALTQAKSMQMDFMVLNTTEDPIASVASMPDSAHYWYLADPLDTIMIRFQTPNDESEAIRHGKGALKDIKRLLKVSKIG